MIPEANVQNQPQGCGVLHRQHCGCEVTGRTALVAAGTLGGVLPMATGQGAGVPLPVTSLPDRQQQRHVLPVPCAPALVKASLLTARPGSARRMWGLVRWKVFRLPRGGRPVAS